MNPEEIINKIVEDRMKVINRFPGDTLLIEQELRIAVASGIEQALISTLQGLPWVKQ